MANRSSVGFGLRPIGKVGQNRDAGGLSEYSVAASPVSYTHMTLPTKRIV